MFLLINGGLNTTITLTNRDNTTEPGGSQMKSEHTANILLSNQANINRALMNERAPLDFSPQNLADKNDPSSWAIDSNTPPKPEATK